MGMIQVFFFSCVINVLPCNISTAETRVNLCMPYFNFISVFFQARPLLAQALEDEDFEGLVDPKLEKNYIGSEMFRMIEAAAACVRHSATRRPRMSQVCMFAFSSLV